MSNHLFEKGNPGGPGRPKGSRNKLGEAFLEALLTTFTEPTAEGKPAGIEALRKTRDEDPATYNRVLAGLLPKEVTGENGEALFSGITVSFVKTQKD